MSLDIEFITFREYEGSIPEPQSAIKRFPQWFSQLKSPSKKSRCPFGFKSKDNLYDIELKDVNTTIKNCLGIQDFLKTGYIIPSWCHFIFREDVNGGMYINWVESPFPTSYHAHHLDTFKDIKNPPNYDSFHKIETPWIIKTGKGVSCLITHPVWHRNNIFTTSTGIFHTDVSPLNIPWIFEYNQKINSGLSLDREDGFNSNIQVIEKDEPIMLIIPFLRKEFKSKVEYVDQCEFNRLGHTQLYQTHHGINFESPYGKFRKKIGNLFR